MLDLEVKVHFANKWELLEEFDLENNVDWLMKEYFNSKIEGCFMHRALCSGTCNYFPQSYNHSGLWQHLYTYLSIP